MNKQVSYLKLIATDILFLVELNGILNFGSCLIFYSSESIPILEKYLSKAISVEEPFYSGTNWAELLTKQAILNSEMNYLLLERLLYSKL
jgi:hypothetical protein